jgi:RHS repeat-associated protein
MTNSSKATVWQAVWTPWGAPHSMTGSAELNLRFPGQYFQIESGLHYNWHRHYDPTTARYTQPDPLGFVDGPSRYAYVGNSPLMEVDPFGLAASFISPRLALPPSADSGVQMCGGSDASCDRGHDLCLASKKTAQEGLICYELWKLCKKGIPTIFGPGIWGKGWGDGL